MCERESKDAHLPRRSASPRGGRGRRRRRRRRRRTSLLFQEWALKPKRGRKVGALGALKLKRRQRARTGPAGRQHQAVSEELAKEKRGVKANGGTLHCTRPDLYTRFSRVQLLACAVPPHARWRRIQMRTALGDHGPRLFVGGRSRACRTEIRGQTRHGDAWPLWRA